MNKNLTQIAFILDRSGSMASMADEAIGGFNAFLAEQQAEEGMAINSKEISKRRRAQRTKKIGF